MLAQRQNNLSLSLNDIFALNLAGWCDITYFLKQAACFRAISYDKGCIRSLHFIPTWTKISLYCALNLLITPRLIIKLII